MSDLRHDPVYDQWVSIASNRRERPIELMPIEQTLQRIICPFCKGNEDETPFPLAVYDDQGRLISPEVDGPWTVRVIPNKYPSFSNENGSAANVNSKANSNADPLAADSLGVDSGPFRTSAGHGIQELIIPSPRHLTSLSELSETELKTSFKSYQDRIENAQSLAYVRHAMLFMNCRSAAGASLGHIHTQLIGSPIVSGRLHRRLERNRNHFAEHGCSLIDSLANWEIQQQIRVVKVTENFCIVCPFASRFAFQTWIIPLKHRTDFLKCPAAMRDELAIHCQKLVTQMEMVIDNPSYNMLLHLDPFSGRPHANSKDELANTNDEAHGGWYVELFPRLTRAAGYEWGTDIWVNPISPESAARRLRDRDE